MSYLENLTITIIGRAGEELSKKLADSVTNGGGIFDQGWAFGHWTIRTAELGSDKIASARLLVGQTPQKRSDKLGQSDNFGQLGSLSDSSALLGHSDSSDNSDKAEPSFPTMKLTRFIQ